jgi:hypothetical protein
MKTEQLVKSIVKAQAAAEGPVGHLARKAAEGPTRQLARKVAESPTAQAAQQVADSPTAKLARKVVEGPTGEAAKQTSSFADELQAIRRQLATPEGSATALAEIKARTDAARAVTEVPERLRPWLRTARGRGVVSPSPSAFRSPVVVPPVPQKIDTDRLIRHAKEIFDEDAEAKRELDQKMVAMMENMHAAMVEANQREAEALDRAKSAEDREVAARARTERREGRMLKLTIGATIIAALSLMGTVATIIVALSASS